MLQPGKGLARSPGRVCGCRSGYWGPAFSAPSLLQAGAAVCVCLALRACGHDDALRIYRQLFKPSKQLDRVCDARHQRDRGGHGRAARRHFTSLQQSFTNLRRGMPGQIPPPIDDIDDFWSPAERALASQSLAVSAVGSPETVARGLQNFLDLTNADELIITAIFTITGRLRSFELVAVFTPIWCRPRPIAQAKVSA